LGFFFQAEDGIRDRNVTGVQTCALPIWHQPVPVVGKWLRTVVQGYFAYYAVPTNLYRLDGFRSEVCRAWRHALKRRSQRNRQTWDRFNRLTIRYIPHPRQVHPYPERRFYALYPR